MVVPSRQGAAAAPATNIRCSLARSIPMQGPTPSCDDLGRANRKIDPVSPIRCYGMFEDGDGFARARFIAEGFIVLGRLRQAQLCLPYPDHQA
jgi:hypothetical protein